MLPREQDSILFKRDHFEAVGGTDKRSVRGEAESLLFMRPLSHPEKRWWWPNHGRKGNGDRSVQFHFQAQVQPAACRRFSTVSGAAFQAEQQGLPNLPFTWHLLAASHLVSRTRWNRAECHPMSLMEKLRLQVAEHLAEVMQQHVAEQSSNRDQNCFKMSMKRQGISDFKNIKNRNFPGGPLARTP